MYFITGVYSLKCLVGQYYKKHSFLIADEKCVVYSPSVIASACLCASIEKITNSWRAALYSRILKDLIGADMVSSCFLLIYLPALFFGLKADFWPS